MKKLFLIFPLLTLSILAGSCGNGPEATSTPVDSVNLHGTAPIEYKHDDPAANSAGNTEEMVRDTVTNPGLSNSSPDLKEEK